MGLSFVYFYLYWVKNYIFANSVNYDEWRELHFPRIARMSSNGANFWERLFCFHSNQFSLDENGSYFFPSIQTQII